MRVRNFRFQERLDFSVGRRATTDVETIRQMIDGCVSVAKAPPDLDRLGVDYLAQLNGGAVLGIDGKARSAGAARHWKGGRPDLALEVWSVVPDERHKGKDGWTRDENKVTDLVLFTYDPSDTDTCYLIGFQPLRIAFRRNFVRWCQQYGRNGQPVQQQTDGRYYSACLFVPANVVLDAIKAASVGRLAQTGDGQP